MKGKILIFGGTTEGRELSQILRNADIDHALSVATEYGADIERGDGEENLLVGRKTAEEIYSVLEKESFSCVVDATHPFAMLASREIRNACKRANIPYYRLSRKTDSPEESDDMVFVSTVIEAGEELNKIPGNILILTGSRDLKEILSRIDDISRVCVRVLPNAESIAKCADAGLSGRQIIAMQGPFSARMNAALIREMGASVILTKESGKSGGFEEKVAAAGECGIKTIVIRNPENFADEGEKRTLPEIVKILSELVDINLPIDIGSKSITLAGVGPGNEDYLTSAFMRKLKKADVIFGAPSVIKRLSDGIGNAVTYPFYRGGDIAKILKENPIYKHPLAIYSGDISLCSGATEASRVLEDMGFEIVRLPGISSVSLFAARLGIALDKVRTITSHGRKCNVMGYIACEDRLMILTSGMEEAADICKSLLEKASEADEKYIITIGFELGTADEQVINVEKESDIPGGLNGKCLLYIERISGKIRSIGYGIEDECFVRGKTPMTKEEIRALTIRKLGLHKDAILFDIGAGTGSVSAEAAMLHPDIEVYSIERDEEAIELLRKNREKLGFDNMHIVEGMAPEALEGLPAPTHAFIGGSGGRLLEMIRRLRSLNKDVKIVINCVTLETLSEITELARECGYTEPDIIQVFVTRYRKVGGYHLADALNPVYIVRL